MNSLLTTIAGGLIEVLARERHVHILGRYREQRPGISYQNQSSAGCIMCINGQPDNTDRVFAPYSRRVAPAVDEIDVEPRSICKLRIDPSFSFARPSLTELIPEVRHKFEAVVRKDWQVRWLNLRRWLRPGGEGSARRSCIGDAERGGAAHLRYPTCRRPARP